MRTAMSRRGLLTVAALPALAAPTFAALADVQPDAALIRDCDRAIAMHDETSQRAINENWSDERLEEACDEFNVLAEGIIATPALTQAGLRAKARIVAQQVTAYASDTPDQSERFALSLLRDLGAEPPRREASAAQ